MTIHAIAIRSAIAAGLALIESNLTSGVPAVAGLVALDFAANNWGIILDLELVSRPVVASAASCLAISAALGGGGPVALRFRGASSAALNALLRFVTRNWTFVGSGAWSFSTRCSTSSSGWPYSAWAAAHHPRAAGFCWAS